jgi:hypothetical protein
VRIKNEAAAVNAEYINVDYRPHDIAVDGKLDAEWAKIENPIKEGTAPNGTRIARCAGNPPDADNLSGQFKAYWTQHALNILVTVKDDVLKDDGGGDWWNDDAVEVYLDVDNSKNREFDGIDDNQIAFLPGRKDWRHHKGLGGSGQMLVDFIRTDDGYIVEAAIPWKHVSLDAADADKPVAGRRIGLNVVLLDDDNGGSRDRRLSWVKDYDAKGQGASHANPQLWGTAELSGQIDEK